MKLHLKKNKWKIKRINKIFKNQKTLHKAKIALKLKIINKKKVDYPKRIQSLKEKNSIPY
jgi:hypothetical protein